MSEWKKIQFAELGETIRGVSYKPSDLREEPSDSAVTLLRSNNIKGGHLNYRDTQFVVKGVVRDNQLLKPQDIAICMSNGNRALVGKAGQFEDRADSLSYTVGAFCSIFRPNESYDPNFVRHLFGSDGYQKHLDVILAGSAINNLKGSDIQEIEAECPPSKTEQTKIAEILSTVDRAIEQTEALIAKQQRLKTGLMQDLLTRGIDEHGNLRSEQTHKFKDSPLGRIPVEWDVSTISSVLIQSPKNGYSPIESDVWNGTYMLGLGCLTVNGFKPRQLKYAPKKTTSIEAALLEPGDFLISRSNTRALVGLVGIFHDIGDPCIYPDLMVRLNFSSEVAPEYMEQVFMSPMIRRQIENVATGTSGSMVKISGAIIKGFQFKKPAIDEQNRILKVLKNKSDEFSKTNASLMKLRSLKTALMQDLLTGRKRVTELLRPE